MALAARNPRARVAIAQAVILLGVLSAVAPSPAMADEYGPPERLAGRRDRPGASRNRPAEYSLLDQLEVAVDRLQGISASAREIEAIEADAQEVVNRSPYPDERIRARRVLRRMARVPIADEPERVPHLATPRAETTADYTQPRPGDRRASPAQYYGPTPEPGCEIPTPATPYAVPAPVMTDPGVPPPINPYQPAVAPLMVAALPPTRHYVSLDALGWWVQGDSLPPLVTTSTFCP